MQGCGLGDIIWLTKVFLKDATSCLRFNNKTGIRPLFHFKTLTGASFFLSKLILQREKKKHLLGVWDLKPWSIKKQDNLCQGKTHSCVVAAVVWLLSHVQLLEIPWTATHQASLCFAISQSLLKLTSIESVMPSSHLVLCHPLLLLPSIFHSIRVSSNELALQIKWPN